MATADALGSPPNPPPLGGFGAPRCRSNYLPPSESAQGELHAHPTALGCPPLRFRPWRGPRRGSRRASRRSRSMLSSKVRCGVPLGLPSHSGRSLNAGPSARTVNAGGAPSAARNGEVRSSSGRCGSGCLIWPSAARSVPRKADQSWPLLLTGDGGDLSRPIPGDCLNPSRHAGPPGKGGTVVPRRMVPARVWIPKRASCSPPSASGAKSRLDAMPGSARGSALLSLKQDL
jgi:hypothetical protein